MQTFTVSGHGGGGKDTSNTGVRITHPESGAVGEGREERSQNANKKRAFERMANSPKFKSWHRIRCAELLAGRSVDQIVNDAMRPENLKIEEA